MSPSLQPSEAAATQTDELTGPRPGDWSSSLTGKPGSSPRPLSAPPQSRSWIPIPQRELSFFQKLLLQPSERSKLHGHVSLGKPSWASWNLCLCISGKNKWAATLGSWLPKVLYPLAVPGVTLAQCWHMVASQLHWLSRIKEKLHCTAVPGIFGAAAPGLPSWTTRGHTSVPRAPWFLVSQSQFPGDSSVGPREGRGSARKFCI